MSKEREILQEIENGTFKFALQQSSKLLKKAPNNTYYKVLHNYALLHNGNTKEAIQSSLDLMAKVPNDTKSLELLNRIFNQVDKPVEALQIFENAAKKYPSFDILTKWFHIGCEEVDLSILSKSSMALKSFQSNKRLFSLWCSFNYYLISISDELSPKEKFLFPKIALKIIEGLKPMKDEQELYLYAEVLRINKLLNLIPVEILKFYENENGDNEGKLDLHLQIILLDTYNELNDLENLFKWSSVVLKDYNMDDFRSWKYLIKSGVSLEQDVPKIIDDYKTSRNTLLSKIEYYTYLKENKNGDNGKVLESIKNYFGHYRMKSCCFADLKHYLDQIDNFSEFVELCESLDQKDITKHQHMIFDLNMIKIKLFHNSALLNDGSFQQLLLDKFNTYKALASDKAPTDLFEGNEFILLFIQSILTQNFTISTVLKSIIILSKLIDKDDADFRIKLWIVQLYQLLNCRSLSTYYYKSLKIKNVQHDLLDHFINSRNGSTSPDRGELREKIINYRKMEKESIYYLKVGYNNGTFNKLGGIIDTVKNFRFSYLRRHVILQGIVAGRLFNDKTLENEFTKDFKELLFSQRKVLLKHDNIGSHRGEFMKDNRDFDIFWDYGHKDLGNISSKLFENIPPADSNIDKVLSLKENFISNDLKGSLGIEINELDSVEGLTGAENWTIKVLVSFGELLKTQNLKDFEPFKRLIMEGSPQIPEEVSWKVPHTYISLIDTFKILSSSITKHSKSFRNNEIKAKFKEIKEILQRSLRELRDDKLPSAKKVIMEEFTETQDKLKYDVDFKKLEITQSYLDDIFNNINNSINESFKLLMIF